MVLTAEQVKKERQAEPLSLSPVTQDELVLNVKDLSVFYGTNEAIKKVSLPIRKNKVTAFIGPSGCGKSTFLRTINRMNDLIDSIAYKGEIQYEDVNLLETDIDVVALRKEIGMVFQRPNPFPKSIYENVAHALKFYGITKRSEKDAIVEESLKQAALWDEVKDRLQDSASVLSGGQQQRLCIARALALKPKILLLDEPSSALDPIASSKIEDLLETLKNNVSIVIVTHNMQQASRVADRTAFFFQGELVEEDETEIIFTNPKQELTERYVTGKFG
ncbi:phosphate ABC transporter ATP-binding protein PstB [Pullulanibacillus sp. KACC 23026]|uniref:phosphate ABC transporter ATP-binding protein PstB n=1 Tax=Pullulanibacillus sp. KACC 23026 TaxID=3028315 RepID=UPI0023AEA096|nr:phosphate ABC transporter ATP-binding protein PstB [Pullulanibacillus sp. KACC 23026]WEG14265.1 phosphate ABC transporter ATP-binding protein PstB [Pullulanibacillus sp. KACC 23026]